MFQKIPNSSNLDRSDHLYFFELILGKLIDDPNFALPYWNWDSPPGMQMPAIFASKDSPLHDPLRNQNHFPSFLLDLDWSNKDEVVSHEEQYKSSLKIMYRQMVSGAKKRTLFSECRSRPEKRRSIRVKGRSSGPHTGMFIFGLEIRSSPIRKTWTLGPNRTDFTDPGWLEAGFVFYNEDKNLVRCKIKDCLDSKKLNYQFQPVAIPWLDTKRTPQAKKKTTIANAFSLERSANAASSKKRELTELSTFPVVLDRVISVVVPRPKKSRSAKEKEDEEEVLVVEGVEFDCEEVVKFDVVLDDEDDDGGSVGPQDTKFAGSFVNVPHREKAGGSIHIASLRLGITDLLEDLGADDDDTVIVTLVPKVGEVKIGGLKIDYIAD
ncbi:Polyphenol oxidase, chloroplastic [Linum perenne]